MSTRITEEETRHEDGTVTKTIVKTNSWPKIIFWGLVTWFVILPAFGIIILLIAGVI